MSRTSDVSARHAAVEPVSGNGHRRQSLAAVSVSTLLLGSGPVAVGLTSLPPEQVAVVRLLLAIPVTALAAAAVRTGFRLRVILASLPGAALFALHLLFFYSALRTTGVADVTFTQALQPLIVLGVAPLLLKERTSPIGLLLALLGIAGVSLVVLGSAQGGSFHLQGELLAVANLLAWTAYFLVSKRTRQRIAAVDYQNAVNLIGGSIALPVAFFMHIDAPRISPADWLLVIYVTVAAGVLGQFLLNWAHPRVDALTSSLIILLAPVVSSIGAAVFLHQPMTPLLTCGAVLVLLSAGKAAGMALQSSDPHRASGEEQS